MYIHMYVCLCILPAKDDAMSGSSRMLSKVSGAQEDTESFASRVSRECPEARSVDWSSWTWYGQSNQFWSSLVCLFVCVFAWHADKQCCFLRLLPHLCVLINQLQYTCTCVWYVDKLAPATMATSWLAFGGLHQVRIWWTLRRLGSIYIYIYIYDIV